MTFESSNREWIEKLSDEWLLTNIRKAMSEGCIRPCHVFDQVDELIERFCRVRGLSELPSVKQ